MRLIWEKHMDLPKEEIKNRLHAYLMEKKYMRKKNDESILFYYNGKIPHRFFQIFYKEGMLHIEGWVPIIGRREGVTTRKKTDVLGDNMQEFARLFSDIKGEEQIMETKNLQHTGFEQLFFPETGVDKTKSAWAALALGFIADFFVNLGSTNILLLPLCMATIFFSVRGMRSSKIYVAMTGLMLGLRIVLKMVTGI